MARLVKLVSAQSGATPTNRRVLYATGTTSVPTLSTQGVLLEGPRYAWVTFQMAGAPGSSFTVDLYAWDPVAQIWTVLKPSSEFQFTVTDTCRHRILLEGGPVRIYPRVSSITGSVTSLAVWISGSVEEP